MKKTMTHIVCKECGCLIQYVQTVWHCREMYYKQYKCDGCGRVIEIPPKAPEGSEYKWTANTVDKLQDQQKLMLIFINLVY